MGVVIAGWVVERCRAGTRGGRFRAGGDGRCCESVVRSWSLGCGACSAERRDRPEALERCGERVGPGPIAIELEVGASPVTHELGGNMQQPLAKAFGLCGRELAGQADQLGPAEQVLGDQRDLEPGLVVLEGVVREVAHAGVLATTDAVLDARAAAVTQLEPSDVVAVLVGEEARVAVAVLVEDRELRAGVGPLAAADQPGALGPRRQVDPVAELGDPRAVTVAAVTIDRLHPHRFRDLRIAARTVSLSS